MKRLLIFALSFFAAAVISVGLSSDARADGVLLAADNNQASEQSAEAATYNYVAQAGDSFSQIARKAAQTYGLEVGKQIGQAGILFVETNMANEAGLPYLNEGQAISIDKNSLKDWFDKAEKLTPEEKAAWETYAPYVDFNTNAIGQVV